MLENVPLRFPIIAMFETHPFAITVEPDLLRDGHFRWTLRENEQPRNRPPVSYVIGSPKSGPFGIRVLRYLFPWLGGAEDDENLEVLGRAEAFVLRQGADGVPVADICRKVGISKATYFNWMKKYEGMRPPEMRRLKQLEDENAKLKKIFADLSRDREMLQDVIRREL